MNPLLPVIQPGLNQVRRILEIANRAQGLRPIGTRLNRSALTRSIVAAHSGYVNNDRFTRQYAAPEVSAGFSFVIDMSDSMSYQKQIDGRGTTWWGECVMLVDALAGGCQRINVKTQVAGCLFENKWAERAEGASTSAVPVICVAKTFHEKWTPQHARRIKGVRPQGGTDLIAYAEASIDLARQIDATHKLAFFLTDGECTTKRYLESLRQQAENEGIRLVGIGLGVEGDKLPNGVSARSAEEVGRKVMGHLEKLLKSRTGIESNDEIYPSTP